MKVQDIRATKLADGIVRVTVAADMERNEDFEASDALVLADLLKEVQERTGGKEPSDDTDGTTRSGKPASKRRRRAGTGGEKAPETSGEDTEKAAGTDAAVSGRRRRRVPEGEDGGSEVQPEPAEPRRRRGRGSVAEENPSSGDAPPAAGEQRRTRRSRSTKDDAATTEAPTENDAKSPSEGRRRRRGAEEKPAEPEKITDADLAKAASEAAEVITPSVVMEILGELDVKSVNDIPDKKRQWFLDELLQEQEAGQ